jgi:3-dehydroquinate synthase
MRTTRFETIRRTATKYVVGPGALFDDRTTDFLSGKPVAVVHDERLATLARAELSALLSPITDLNVLPLRGGERSKSFDQLQRVLSFFDRCNIPKHGIVVAIGGGTICDVVAQAAMLMRRGISLVLIPSTLLAQIDAAVGGKNGINYRNTKNLVGHFYHPDLVVCDQAFLSTLPDREITCGIAEAIKVFAVSDADALARHRQTWLRSDRVGALDPWADVVWEALRWKLALLTEDPYEESSRRLLNYGHAFAHLFEEKSDYALSHGEAVLLGMMIENETSRGLGIAVDSDLDDLQDIIRRLLTTSCRRHWVRFTAIREDLGKLRGMRRGHLNLVCLVRPGQGQIVDDAPENVLEAAWERTEHSVELSSSEPSTINYRRPTATQSTSPCAGPSLPGDRVRPRVPARPRRLGE